MDEESKQRVQALVEQAEYNSPANQAIRATQQVDTRLKEMQIILESMPNVVAELRSIEDNLAPLTSVLEAIRDKETPEMPDYAQPIVDALNKAEGTLSQAIKKIDVKPNVSVAAPEVNVSPTDVKVDLKGVEKLMKSDLPQAFKDAIKLIPKTEIPENDYSELAQKVDKAVDWLESIEHQSRLKPQFPNTLKVTNPDGTSIGSTETLIERFDYDDATTIYVAEAPKGSLSSQSVWDITKFDLTDTNNASGLLAVNAIWDNRTSETYS